MAQGGFELTVRQQVDGATNVAIAGVIDMASTYDFDDALRRIEREHPVELVLDLSQLDFMDSAGLSRLVALHTRCRRASRPLTLVRGPQIVDRLLALSRLDDTFHLVGAPAA